MPVYDHTFFQDIDQLIQNNSVRRQDKAMIALLKGLGIEKGKSFNPDDTQKRAMDEGLKLAYEKMQTDFITEGRILMPLWKGKNQWMIWNFAKGQAQLGLPSLPHAGETEGPPSIWGAINVLSAVRIGHGVRCLEDPELVRYLHEKQIPLEVCPTSNVCLGVVPTLEEHPLPKLLEEGLFVTINSDDPPMFDTTLTDEYLRIVKTFDFDISLVQQFVVNGIRASLLSLEAQRALENEFREQFAELGSESGI